MAYGQPPFAADPFALGVASGDPVADGFVLWTRLAPDPLDGGGMLPEAVPVRWEVARDVRFLDIARQGETLGAEAAECEDGGEDEPNDCLPVSLCWFRKVGVTFVGFLLQAQVYIRAPGVLPSPAWIEPTGPSSFRKLSRNWTPPRRAPRSTLRLGNCSVLGPS